MCLKYFLLVILIICCAGQLVVVNMSCVDCDSRSLLKKGTERIDAGRSAVRVKGLCFSGVYCHLGSLIILEQLFVRHKSAIN